MNAEEKQLTENVKNKINLHLSQGTQLFNEKKFSGAREHFLQALALSPNNELIHFNIGNTYLAEEKAELAIPYLLKSCQSNNPNHLKTLILVQFYQGHFENLIPPIQRLIANRHITPEDQAFIQSIIEQIAISHYQSNSVSCIEWCALGLTYFNNHVTFWELLIHSHIKSGNYEKAILLCQEQSNRHKATAELEYLKGTALFYLEKNLDAQQAFETSAHLDKNQQIAPDYHIRNSLKLGDTARAQSLLKIYTNHFSESASYYDMHANLYSLLGDLDALRLHTHKGLKYIIENGAYASAAKPNSFIGSDAITTLTECKHILDQQNINYFLVCGTLLGVIREGDLLKHDKDLDIGIFENTHIDQLIDALTKDNVFRRVNVIPDCTPPIFLSFMHNRLGITIDVFVYKNIGEKLISGIYKLPHPIASLYSSFEISQIEWRNERWNIPSNPEKYLNELYGNNWKTPDPLFDTVVSSQIKTRDSIPARLIYGYCKLIELVQRKQFKKAIALIEQIQYISPDDELNNIKHTLSTEMNSDQK